MATESPATEHAETESNNAPGTDTENVTTTEKSETTKDSRVEEKDGSVFVDGVRLFTRHELNKFASVAKAETINELLSDLKVDSLDQVKEVIGAVRNSVKNDGDSPLDIKALQQAVATREATVEELQEQVKTLRTDLLLKDHIGNLNNAMPNEWNADQRSAVVDLMKVRNMFVVEGESFQLKNGDDFLTVDGEKPDYKAAVELMGKTLGLNTAKKGVKVVNIDQSSSDNSEVKKLDEARLKTDVEYNSAFLDIRRYRTGLLRSLITNNMVTTQMDKMRKANKAQQSK